MEIWGTSKGILRRYKKIDDRRGRQIHGRYVEIHTWRSGEDKEILREYRNMQRDL
jgi:hypothetical protein